MASPASDEAAASCPPRWREFPPRHLLPRSQEKGVLLFHGYPLVSGRVMEGLGNRRVVLASCHRGWIPSPVSLRPGQRHSKRRHGKKASWRTAEMQYNRRLLIVIRVFLPGLAGVLARRENGANSRVKQAAGAAAATRFSLDSPWETSVQGVCDDAVRHFADDFVLGAH